MNALIELHNLILLFLLDISVPTISSEIDYVVISIQFVVMIIGLAVSAFSGSEVAFFSLSSRLESLTNAEIPHPADSRILTMLDKPRRLLATILIGNTFANIIASVMAAVITGSFVAHFGLSEVVVFTAEVVVLTFMILIISEITVRC